MPKITSKTLLVVGTELTIDESTKTFTLNVAGNLVAKDGVTLQALYSKFADLWLTATYQDSPFPMNALDALSGQFYFGVDAGGNNNGWKPANDTTRQMLRDAGWREYSSTGVLNREYAGIVGLGSVSAGSQLYYQLAAVDAPTNFTFTDQCNEGIQVYGDATNGGFDKRAFFKGFVREYAKKYKDSVLADTGKTASGPFLVNLLLSNENDLKILANDAAMTGAPYSGITITYYAADQLRAIGGTSYPFRVIVAGNGATLEQIYTKVQFQLRQATDVDAGTGTVIGKTAAALLAFVGDSLETTTGVYIDNIQAADSNRITFKDQNGINRTNPFSSAGTISFNAALIGAGSSYRLMFTTLPGLLNDYGESGAVTVNDAAGTPITGTISTGSLAFTFDYDGNIQGTRVAATDAAVTLIGIKPGFGKFAVATGILSRSKAISLSLVAEADRAYG